MVERSQRRALLTCLTCGGQADRLLPKSDLFGLFLFRHTASSPLVNTLNVPSVAAIMDRPRHPARQKSAEIGPVAIPSTLTPSRPFVPDHGSDPCPFRVRSVQVDALLSGGKGRWGQVYSGRILEADGLSQGGEPRVIVKLIDPRLFERHLWEDERSPEAVALESMMSESSSYAALIGVPVVPTWYGSYHVRVDLLMPRSPSDPSIDQFTLLEGHQVVGHVIELVEGSKPTAKTYFPEGADAREIESWVRPRQLRRQCPSLS